MASLAWTVARIVTAPVVVATFVAVGITAGLLLLSTRRSSARVDARLSRVEREAHAIREESECRWLANRIWLVNKDLGRSMCPPEEN